jgi:hypothetical protein
MSVDYKDVPTTAEPEASPMAEGIRNALPPTEPTTLSLGQCMTNMVYENGTSAPDQKINYSIAFTFESEGDRQALLNHPDVEEIASTMQAFMRDHPGTEQSFAL